ncbi:MAG: alpha/beta hydrolase family protein [Acidimicrobiales bacterium]
MSSRPWPAIALVAIAVAVVAAACGGDGADSAGGGRAPARYEVTMRTETFVDASRPTAAAGNLPAKPSRELVSDIYHPAAPKPGGYPLVVFAHGSGSNAGNYRVLLRAWAEAGYVVVAPTFPLTSTTFRAGPADVVNQPADVAFLIGEMLRSSPDLVDANRIAVAGHSLGAETALVTAYNSCCRDGRVKAAIVLAGAERDYAGGTYFVGAPEVPLLVVHGEADTTVPIAEGERIFNDAPAPKVMLVLPTSDLPSTDHVGPFVGANGNPTQRTSVVVTATVSFLDRYLSGRADALGPLRTTVDQEIGYRLQVVD